MIFELTQDYQIFVPLMIANMLSFVIARHYQSKPLYRALLEQDNVHLPDLRTRITFSSWRARDIMTREFTIIPAGTPVVKVAKSIVEDGLKCLPVGDHNSLIGMVTREQVQEAMITGLGDKPISSIATRNFPHAHADHPIEVVLERLDKGPGLLPVVDRNATGHLEGVITPQNVTQFVESKWKERTGSRANV